jgi:hypothetical protein
MEGLGLEVMAETPEQRRERSRRERERMAVDPEYAKMIRERRRKAEKKYESKKRELELEPGAAKRKPGRLVASFGWLGWR